MGMKARGKHIKLKRGLRREIRDVLRALEEVCEEDRDKMFRYMIGDEDLPKTWPRIVLDQTHWNLGYLRAIEDIYDLDTEQVLNLR